MTTALFHFGHALKNFLVRSRKSPKRKTETRRANQAYYPANEAPVIFRTFPTFRTSDSIITLPAALPHIRQGAK